MQKMTRKEEKQIVFLVENNIIELKEVN